MKNFIFAAVVALMAGSAWAACDNKTLKGDFRVSGAGSVNGNTCGAIGIANFDGKQTMKFTGVEGCGAATVPSIGVLTYSVIENCMGTATDSNTGRTYYFSMDKKMQKGSIFASVGNAVIFGGMEKQ